MQLGEDNYIPLLWLVALQPGWINASWNPYSMAPPENSIHLKKAWLGIK